MNAILRVSTILLLIGTVAGCAHESTAAHQPPPVVGEATPAISEVGRANAASSTASVVPVPSLDTARAVALRWVASTGELLKMGPIGRSELLRQRVASVSAKTMTENLTTDLAKLSDKLPIASSELRLIETPLTADVSIDAATGQARAQVWSVVLFGAKDLGAPRMVFRTSQLTFVIEAGEWRLAGFTAVEGPTPIATDALPADWDGFALVASWRPAAGGER